VRRYNFTQNYLLICDYLQPIDILYIVNGIAVALRGVSLDDEDVRAHFIVYAWESVGVWVTNAF